MEKKIENMFPTLSAQSCPSVVWFQDVSDDQTIKKIDGAIMGNEAVGLALKRFNCFRVNVLDMPEGDIKKGYMREVPAFYFFDPAGQLVRKVNGKRATSLSSVNKLIGYTWDKCFTMKIKVYQKRMKKILDGFDKVDVKQQAVDRDRAKLDERPNPSLEKKIKMEEEVIAQMRKEVEEEEQEIFKECTLEPEFLPQETADSE